MQKKETGVLKIYPLTLLLYMLMAGLSLVATSCAWSEADYKEISSIRTEALALIDKSSTDDFTAHKADVDKLDQRMNAIIAKNKPKVGVKMLTVVEDKQRFTWGGFTKLWSDEGKLKPAAVSSAKQNVDMAFAEVLAIGKKGGINWLNIK